MVLHFGTMLQCCVSLKFIVVNCFVEVHLIMIILTLYELHVGGKMVKKPISFRKIWLRSHTNLHCTLVGLVGTVLTFFITLHRK